MDRRHFIKTAGALTGSASVLSIASLAQAGPVPGMSGAQVQRVRTSIQASFGPGFQVIASEPSPQGTHALIEHQGNLYKVSSADLLDWEVVQATRL